MISIKKFTERCRQLQSLYREEIQEPMGKGPWKNSKTRQISMIEKGEKSGKNFVDSYTFRYAKLRVARIKKNETINEFRLFNNLLSSQPMAFNLFCPLMHMLKDGHQELVTTLVRSVFPHLPIGQVTKIKLEYLHTNVEKYLNDKTAMDAIIRYKDNDGRRCFIAIETKYTDVLGTKSAEHTEKQKALIKQLGFFQLESEKALVEPKKPISQIYRNFLLSECYRIKERAHECHSIVLSPKDHPTTKKEVKSLQDELLPEYRYKIQALSLEDFVDRILAVCPPEYSSPFVWFRHRYLDFSRVRNLKVELRKWSLADKKELMELCNAVDRTYLSDRLPNPYTEEDADWWLNMVAKSEGIDGTFRAVVVNGNIIGSVSVERKADNKLDGELGYMLLKEYWNRGIMTQAVRQACDVAIKELGLNRITANVYHPNVASQHILLKNGFVQEGVKRKAVIKGDNVYDILIFGLLK